MDETEIREKLRKIEALFAGAGYEGERVAAAAAAARIRAKLGEAQRAQQQTEMQFSLGNTGRVSYSLPYAAATVSSPIDTSVSVARQ